MASRSDDLPATHRFLFKPIENCQGGGCHLDLWIPGKAGDGLAYMSEAVSPYPLAIMIHGGAWTIGSSTAIPYNQVNYLLDQGVAVCSLEYRLMPHVRMKEIREDWLDAYIFIQRSLNSALSAAGDSSQIRTDQICCMGWSAGGSASFYLTHDILAHNTAETFSSEQLYPIKAIVSTYPLSDPNCQFIEEPLSDSLQEDDPEREEREEMMTVFDGPVMTGAHTDDWAKEPLGTPLGNRFRWLLHTSHHHTFIPYLLSHAAPYPSELTAMGLITPAFPPVFIVVATADTLLKPLHSYNTRNRCVELGVEVELKEAVGMPHAITEEHFSTWPEGVSWWEEALLPGLEFAIARVKGGTM